MLVRPCEVSLGVRFPLMMVSSQACLHHCQTSELVGLKTSACARVQHAHMMHWDWQSRSAAATLRIFCDKQWTQLPLMCTVVDSQNCLRSRNISHAIDP